MVAGMKVLATLLGIEYKRLNISLIIAVSAVFECLGCPNGQYHMASFARIHLKRTISPAFDLARCDVLHGIRVTPKNILCCFPGAYIAIHIF